MDAIGQCGNAGGSGDFAGIGVILCVGLATIVGTIGGAVVGAMKGLPREDLGELNAELDEYVRLHERPQDRLIEVLSDRIGAIRELSSRDPDLLLGVRLDEVRIDQHPGRELSLVVAARVEIELPKSTADDGRRYERGYRFAGTRRPVEDWLERRGAGVAARVDEAFAGLADEIVRDLFRERAR